jgi:prepilin-type N-terminal cleavage/methylation domain-containing protein
MGGILMNRKGFTLVEMMVALVIFTIGLLAVVQMSLLYVQANTYNHRYSASVAVAQTKMDELRSFARSDRQDNFSPFDFDYLVSTASVFASVVKPGGTDEEIAGLLSGAGGVGRKVIDWDGSGTETDGDSIYDVLSLNGGVYSMSDEVRVFAGDANSPAIIVQRRWTVTPDATNDPPQYAMLAVKCWWTDRQGDHEVNLASCVFRRQ